MEKLVQVLTPHFRTFTASLQGIYGVSRRSTSPVSRFACTTASLLMSTLLVLAIIAMLFTLFNLDLPPEILDMFKGMFWIVGEIFVGSLSRTVWVVATYILTLSWENWVWGLFLGMFWS